MSHGPKTLPTTHTRTHTLEGRGEVRLTQPNSRAQGAASCVWEASVISFGWLQRLLCATAGPPPSKVYIPSLSEVCPFTPNHRCPAKVAGLHERAMGAICASPPPAAGLQDCPGPPPQLLPTTLIHSALGKCSLHFTMQPQFLQTLKFGF